MRRDLPDPDGPVITIGRGIALLAVTGVLEVVLEVALVAVLVVVSRVALRVALRVAPRVVLVARCLVAVRLFVTSPPENSLLYLPNDRATMKGFDRRNAWDDRAGRVVRYIRRRESFIVRVKESVSIHQIHQNVLGTEVLVGL